MSRVESYVLIDGPVNDARIDAIRHRLYELEWECGEVLCSVVRSHEEWDSPAIKRCHSTKMLSVKESCCDEIA